jgi:hypothetical protein
MPERAWILLLPGTPPRPGPVSLDTIFGRPRKFGQRRISDAQDRFCKLPTRSVVSDSARCFMRGSGRALR